MLTMLNMPPDNGQQLIDKWKRKDVFVVFLFVFGRPRRSRMRFLLPCHWLQCYRQHHHRTAINDPPNIMDNTTIIPVTTVPIVPIPTGGETVFPPFLCPLPLPPVAEGIVTPKLKVGLPGDPENLPEAADRV